ncbi:MAG: hypothetical protein RLZZ164_1085 [Actinomycetota bacterium]|jgi:hypothetical protein
MSDQREQLAAKLGISKVDGKHQLDHRSLLQGMGGWHAILESVLPGFAFVLTFAITRTDTVAVIVAVVLSALFLIWRLAKRQSVLNAIVGLVGIGLAAWLALRDGGSGRDYFVTGFYTNGAYFTVLALSVLVRFPIIGLLLGFVLGEGLSWRTNKYEMRVFTTATALLAGVFALRLAVQLPLYFANQLEALAIAKLVLGLPLYASVIWIEWLLIRNLLARR